MDKELQDIIKKLLTEKKAEWAIGYEKAYDEFSTRPAFVCDPADTTRLMFNKYCVNNLGLYLTKLKKNKLAVVCKGCDVATVFELIREKQFKRENVTIIGVACEGVYDKRTNKLLEKCENCQVKQPKGADFTVGNAKNSEKPKNYIDVVDFEKKSSKEKVEFWNRQFEKCIRCYACRNVCPVCYCPDCFALRSMPEYLSKHVDAGKNKLFHMIRMQHVFGRCTDCKACDTACPVNIPLSLLTKKLAKDAKELFNYESGADTDARPPLSTYDEGDSESDIM
ncbi:MAG: hypothetical protein A2044_06295 [Candidatus Firestonebacteria bacterium GWA2_43_8]|nr:MAG: hypothetical protein A2044_06295 [Candidatus Firestonebacteria bacterium GWA2_43_8]